MTPRSLTPLLPGIVTGTVSLRPGCSLRATRFGGWTTRFGEPLYPARRYTGAPRDRDSTSAPGFARPRLDFAKTTHFPSVGAAAPIGAYLCRSTRLGGAS